MIIIRTIHNYIHFIPHLNTIADKTESCVETFFSGLHLILIATPIIKCHSKTQGFFVSVKTVWYVQQHQYNQTIYIYYTSVRHQPQVTYLERCNNTEIIKKPVI